MDKRLMGPMLHSRYNKLLGSDVSATYGNPRGRIRQAMAFSAPEQTSEGIEHGAPGTTARAREPDPGTAEGAGCPCQRNVLLDR